MLYLPRKSNELKKKAKKKKKSMMTKVLYLDNESLFFSKNFRKYTTVQNKSLKISTW